MNCPKCNAPALEGYEFCGQCGQKINLSTTSEPSENSTHKDVTSACRNCGADLGSDNQFCGECGTRVEQVEKAQESSVAAMGDEVPAEVEETTWEAVKHRKDADSKKTFLKDRPNEVQKKETRLSLKKRSLLSSKKLLIGVSLVTLLAVGGIFYLLQDYTRVARLYSMAAFMGYTPAMYKLGTMYEYGRGVNATNAEAMRWYRKAADRGNGKAMTSLAFMYLFGKGVAKDNVEAFQWFRKAAEKNIAIAMLWVGMMYGSGEGVAVDHTKAEIWYRKAVDKGNAAAAMRLGYMYEKGLGVAKDYTEAMHWYRKAADMGYTPANSAIKSLSTKRK